MNRSAASRTPRYQLPAFLAAMVPTPVSTPSTNGQCSVDPPVSRNTLRSSTRHLVYAKYLAVRPVSGPPHQLSLRTSPEWVTALALPRHGSRKDEPTFTDSRFDALTSCFLECLRVRKANDPQEDSVVHCVELGEVFRTYSPPITSVQQSLKSPWPWTCELSD